MKVTIDFPNDGEVAKWNKHLFTVVEGLWRGHLAMALPLRSIVEHVGLSINPPGHKNTPSIRYEVAVKVKLSQIYVDVQNADGDPPFAKWTHTCSFEISNFSQASLDSISKRFEAVVTNSVKEKAHAFWKAYDSLSKAASYGP